VVPASPSMNTLAMAFAFRKCEAGPARYDLSDAAIAALQHDTFQSFGVHCGLATVQVARRRGFVPIPRETS